MLLLYLLFFVFAPKQWIQKNAQSTTHATNKPNSKQERNLKQDVLTFTENSSIFMLLPLLDSKN
jgi:hypothetical protein